MKKVFLAIGFALSIVAHVSAQTLATQSGVTVTLTGTVQVYCQGGWDITGASSLDMQGTSKIHMVNGTTSTSEDWTDNVAGGAMTATSTGTVYFESATHLQNISGSTPKFANVVLNNPNHLSQNADVEIRSVLTLQSGQWRTNANRLFISSNASGAIVYTGGGSAYSQSWVVPIYGSGRLDREIINSGSTYYFPVGSTTKSQLLEVIPTNITGISRLSASWEASVTGASPLSISECGTAYTQVSNGAEWHLRPANAGSYGTGSFAGGSITFTGWGLSTFPGLTDNQFGMVWRQEGDLTPAGWQVPTPSCTSLNPANTFGRTVAGDAVVRNNLTQYSDAVSQLGIAITIVQLPIELKTFFGWIDGPVNQLEWVTASELNTNHFDINRSASGVLFNKIGEVAAAGNSNTEHQYTFTDAEPFLTSYYQLGIVDNDSSLSYSNVVVLVRTVDGDILTLQNQVDENLTLEIESNSSYTAHIALVNVVGQTLAKQNLHIVSGTNKTMFDTRFLPAGMYFLVYRNTAKDTENVYKVIVAHK